jgi:hypothetical protein
LENLSVSHIPDINYFPEKSQDNIDESLKNQIYSSLPDPLTIWYNQPKLISQKSHITKVFSGDTLFYKKATNKGALVVSNYKPATVYPRTKHTMLILFVFFVIATCVWFLLKFMAKVLLNLNQENPSIPDINWLDLFQKNEQKRIVLSTFNGTCFLNKTKEWLNSSRNKTIKIEEIKAIAFLDPTFKISTVPSHPRDVIWISGISQIIYDFKKHEKLLSVITGLNQNSKARIIIELPFNFDLINEFYNEFITSNELESEKQAEIYSMQLKWKNLFDNYYIYEGFINQDTGENKEHLREEDSYWEDCKPQEAKVQFQNIWSNLSLNEKILLYDLADDGLLNRKNKTMIQRLVDKRLIIENPYPALFSGQFESFVRHNLKSDEVKSIENKLGVKGSWHNTKYIILLIVVPLAALIFISQGISLEKAFTILGGGLAVLTGIIRLFDSGLFKSSSS